MRRNTQEYPYVNYIRAALTRSPIDASRLTDPGCVDEGRSILGTWKKDECDRIVAEHERSARGFRERGDVRQAEWCEAWARYFRDRGEGRPGEDVIPAPPSYGRVA